MNDNERRRYEMMVRVKQFGIDNGGDFGGIASTKFSELSVIVNTIDSKAGEQQAGFGSSGQQFEIKDTARENLRDLMSDTARTARSMEYEFDGISDLFRFQRNLPDADLLAKARAFITEAAPFVGPFKEYQLSDDIVAELTPLADAFEASLSTTASAVADQIAATADVGAKIREGMIRIRILDGIVQNKYENNPGKLAAWLSAKHVEKAPKKKAPTP